MLNYLHDIRNKLTLISGHTAILCKKYGEEDFVPIKTNLVRISELVNDAYRQLKESSESNYVVYTPKEFVRQMDLLTETMQLLYSLDFKNEVFNFSPMKKDFEIDFNISLVFQVLENALDNSLKAKSSKVIIRMLEVGNFVIYEIVDNGESKVQTVTNLDEISILPHGIGKEIIINNMSKINGKVEWTRRLDYSGMIVRLYFPKKPIVI